MRSPFHALSRPALAGLADALGGGRLAPPFSAISLQRYAPGPDAGALATELQRLSTDGMQPAQLAYLLRAIATEREAAQRTTDRVELVWTGPERTTSASRDTGVVVRELFSAARHGVYVAGFAVHKGRSVFRALADNMASNPTLTVRMFLNIGRKHHDARSSGQVVQEFMQSFASNDWPGGRLPELYHDPRALLTEAGPRASLHAKCIVVDNRWSFITSANFTEAAQERNIEAGLVVDDVNLAAALRAHLDALIETGIVQSAGAPAGRPSAPGN
jgi:phosphatidylserine/phosphatidylglycerophosphate/cardiolipin synthase-like enzyme